MLVKSIAYVVFDGYTLAYTEAVKNWYGKKGIRKKKEMGEEERGIRDNCIKANELWF